jgi:hypothetical protein
MNINVLVVFYVFKRIEEILGNYIYIKKFLSKINFFLKKLYMITYLSKRVDIYSEIYIYIQV